jgi:hypothetical protein
MFGAGYFAAVSREACSMRLPRRKLYVVLLMVVVLRFPAVAQQPDTEEEGQLRFRFVGPHVGNRIASVAGIPGDPSTYYAGAASGGVWKSIDGGNGFVPVFDKQPAAAIGALAVAPSDPSVVWAGTGEAWVIRDSDAMGGVRDILRLPLFAAASALIAIPYFVAANHARPTPRTSARDALDRKPSNSSSRRSRIAQAFKTLALLH